MTCPVHVRVQFLYRLINLAGIGAPGACHVGEHVVVRALEGDAPLLVAADFRDLYH